jgi:hypothetical protein
MMDWPADPSSLRRTQAELKTSVYPEKEQKSLNNKQLTL